MDRGTTSVISLERKFRRQQIVLLLISLGGLLLVWELVAHLSHIPVFVLPTPELVFVRLLKALRDTSLLYHSSITLSEVLAGLTLGIVTATSLGYFLAKSPLFERLLAPYVVASQSIPVVAIAPLLVIWFGTGIFSKILISAMIVFFPILINTVVGLRSVPEDLYDLMRSYQANRTQTLWYLEIPAALPVFLGGLRVGATLSVIGAVVGEFVGSDRGLGFLINVARGQYDTALVFVAIFALIFMAMGLYGLVVAVETSLLKWQQRPEANALDFRKE